METPGVGPFEAELLLKHQLVRLLPKQQSYKQHGSRNYLAKEIPT